MDEEHNEEPVVLKVPVECYSRIVGYLRPVQYWNAGKKQEFEERATFDMKKALNENPHSQVKQPVRDLE